MRNSMAAGFIDARRARSRALPKSLRVSVGFRTDTPLSALRKAGHERTRFSFVDATVP